MEILAVSGDNHLGGSDFDRLIADMFWKSCGLSENRFSAEDAAIVLERAENCKFELTGQETAQMCVTLAGERISDGGLQKGADPAGGAAV